MRYHRSGNERSEYLPRTTHSQVHVRLRENHKCYRSRPRTKAAAKFRFVMMTSNQFIDITTDQDPAPAADLRNLRDCRYFPAASFRISSGSDWLQNSYFSFPYFALKLAASSFARANCASSKLPFNCARNCCEGPENA